MDRALGVRKPGAQLADGHAMAAQRDARVHTSDGEFGVSECRHESTPEIVGSRRFPRHNGP